MKREINTKKMTFVKGALAAMTLAFAANSHAQSCPTTPPPMDVLLFLDNSGSITNAEFDAAQQAIADIATDILARPGYRLAVVNWACNEAGGSTLVDTARDGCRIDLATGSAIAGGWSSNPADFAYVGNNSSSNKVCRSFGHNGSGDYLHRNNCGGPNFTASVASDFAQHALKMLEGALYSGGGTGGTDSNGAATVAPGAPSSTNRLMLIHMTDAGGNGGSRIREVPVAESALGNYYYSNRFKNVRNALVVGVGIDYAAGSLTARRHLGAFSSRGGASTDYDTAHQTAPSTAAVDIGTPRLATFSATYNAAQILAATTSALNATIPACVVMRKQSVGGVGSFNFTGGTNGLPASLALTTTAVSTPVASPAYTLSGFNTDTGIQETITPDWELSGVSCVNASNASVPVTSNPTTGQITIPGAQITAGARLTCTVTNTRVQPNFGTCDARMFLATSSAGALNTQLNLINRSANPVSYTPIGSPAVPAYDAIGFNPLDSFLYGIDYSGYAGNELFRIGSNGAVVNLGAMTLSTGGSFPNVNVAGGAFSPTGEYYISSRITNTLYRVNLVTRVATPVLTSAELGIIVDFAFVGNYIYAPLNMTQLVRIDPVAGSLTVVGAAGSTGGGAPSVWGSSNEGLFSLGGGALYQWNIATGTRILLGQGPLTDDADGASCPTAPSSFNADLSVTKTNTPAQGPNDLPDDTYTPGETRTYTIVVSNSGPFGAHGVTVSDPLPAGITSASWTCSGTAGGICTASGSGAINDTAVGLPVGASVTYLLTLTVPPDYTGNLSNTVTVTPGSTTIDTNAANNTATDVDQPNPSASLWITKTNTPALGPNDQPDDTVLVGTETTYDIVLGNNGPSSVVNAVLRDFPSSELTGCVLATPACAVVSGMATCPVEGNGAGQLSVTNLASAVGVQVPLLQPNSSLRVRLTCTVQ